MTPSGLQAIFGRIAELQQPPGVVAAFASAYSSQLDKAAKATTNAPTTEVGDSTSTSRDPAAATPTTVEGVATRRVAAQRAVTAAVSTTIASAGNLPAAAKPWLNAIRDAATRNGVDPELLTSLVWVESSFQPDALSPAGAIGLAQLMPDTARSLKVDPHDPTQNLDGAARMLSGLITTFGDVGQALAAYNVGPNGLRRGLAEGRTPGAGYAAAVAAKYRTITGRELLR
jgi:soluble lytic murein transglycosylase-like protein